MLSINRQRTEHLILRVNGTACIPPFRLPYGLFDNRNFAIIPNAEILTCDHENTERIQPHTMDLRSCLRDHIHFSHITNKYGLFAADKEAVNGSFSIHLGINI